MSDNIVPSGGLQSLDELSGFEYVRPEFGVSVFSPKITLDYDCATFNTSCVKLFPESEYVQILANRAQKRLLIWPCGKYDKAAVKWSIIKNGKPGSRGIRAKLLCAKVFQMMSWNINYRYKVMAVYQELGGLRFCVFNLAECEMYAVGEEPRDDGTAKKTRKRMFPIDWERTFGTPYGEFHSTFETDINSLHLLSNSTLDDMAERPVIIPRVPTSGEIITREYYVPDDIIEKGRLKR